MTKVTDRAGNIVDPYRGFIATSRYSRWLDEQSRREIWTETVDRYISFMSNHVEQNYAGTIEEPFWLEAREAILNHDVMPSMRALMTAGPALARENLAQFNCSFVAVDDLRAFDESLYILMNGVGLGFSVEGKYVSQLPAVAEHFEKSNTTIVVEDSKAGWARAVREVVAMAWIGQIPIIDVSKVRPSGARLKTFGGRASGPQPLVNLMDHIIATAKNAAGRQLTDEECHSIMTKIGEVVVVGGVRRAAELSQSDLNSYAMARAKSGAWWKDNPHYALANNSAVFYKQPSVGEFLQFYGDLYESKSGERGIINMEGLRNSQFTPRRDMSKISGLNPCGEILLRSKQLCNLTEVIVESGDSIRELERKVKIATVLGTVQSTLTNFKYLRKIWKDNCDEERLLGVSLTGQFGHSRLSGSEGLDVLADSLQGLKRTAVRTNDRYAKRMGINVSTAITTVKPSGTVSQLTGSSSGMHPWHAEHYLRTVRGDNNDPMTQFMKDMDIPNEPEFNNPTGTTVFTFPIKAPAGALTREDITAIDHLEIWKVYKAAWTEHNPSVTISVREDEWIEVANWVYKNWDFIGGISFLPYSEHTYVQAPYQEATEASYLAAQANMPKHIDWSLLSAYEQEDTTTGSQTLACTAGNCEVVDIRSTDDIPFDVVEIRDDELVPA